MRVIGDTLTLSATDLSNFLSCRHLTALDMATARGKRTRRYVSDPLLDILRQRGLDHEREYIESLRRDGRQIVDLRAGEDRFQLTLDAMRAGADIIVQGALADGQWIGYPDVLQRIDTPSAFGAWSYEVADTKLARETRAGTILQLGLYSEMLAAAQGRRPEFFYVVTPDTDAPKHEFRVDDYAAYFRLIRQQMVTTVAHTHEEIAAANYPEPVEHCSVCSWSSGCDDRRHDDDHLSLVAGITRLQRRELESRQVETLTALAGMPWPLDPKPRRGSIETYFRVREQARVQLQSKGRTPPAHEMRPFELGKGLNRLPEPSLGDVFLDLEGDAFAAEGGREYLFGVVTTRPDGGPVYRSFWAFNERDERAAFEAVMDLILAAWNEHDGMHVYHYAPYEPAAFKRLMGRYATRDQELDRMLRSGRFVDLYGVVRQCMYAGVESYSIKRLEPLYGFDRDVALDDANRNLRLMDQALWLQQTDTLPQEVLDSVEGYNRDDCISTLKLRDWLEHLRAQLEESGTSVPRPTPAAADAPPNVSERAQIVEALRLRLLEGVPEAPDPQTIEEHARWLLAYMLDYHRREDKVTWWEYFRLRDMPDEELFDEPEAIAGLEYVSRVDVVRNKKTRKPTGSVIDRYKYPLQEMELDIGDKLILREETRWGEIIDIDRAARTIDMRVGRKAADLRPTSAFAHTHVPSEAQEAALLRLGASVAASERVDSGAPSAARDLLLVRPPRLRAGSFMPGASEIASDFAVRIVGDLDRSVLPIQGPPGSGKTHAGARMICALARAGKKVGVVATSHKVILNLLDAVYEVDPTIRLAHKGDEDATVPAHVSLVASNNLALQALQSGAAQVLGGTSWVWADAVLAGSVDVLFVDEAAQMSLANVLAVCQAADSVILLGDPQQLEQPRKGSHPDGVGVSALQHILGDHQTISSERGIFLPITWRLAPSICEFTSELFYENKLRSNADTQRQRLTGAGELDGAGLWMIEVDHDGNRTSSPEEVAVVADLVTRLTAKGVQWTNAAGVVSQMTGKHILVVAPYNAQVSRLAERLAGTGVSVGTVDKFQGQERPVVIYSMTTSRPEDAPRGMEFLYSLNRLNVATSRARCAAIVVASPRLFEPECRTPRQMKLANALCRYREMGRSVVPIG